jgi:hypothetical protein
MVLAGTVNRGMGLIRGKITHNNPRSRMPQSRIVSLRAAS